jgi:hypothetical protein
MVPGGAFVAGNLLPKRNREPLFRADPAGIGIRIQTAVKAGGPAPVQTPEAVAIAVLMTRL